MQFAACCGLVLGVVHGLLALDLRHPSGLVGVEALDQAPWASTMTWAELP